jgi:hypothetical protein
VKECKLREFGVGGGDPDALIFIDSIEKIDGEEPIYRITMEGRRFQVNLEQLYSYNQFKKIALGATDRFLPMMKQHAWEDFMQDQLEKMFVQKAASDTQTQDRVIKIFKRFAEKCETKPLETCVKRNIPHYDGSGIVFRGDDLLNIVDKSLTKLPREKAWSYMQDFGCVLVEFTIEGLGRQTFWKYQPNPGEELWFDPYRKEKK